MTDDEVEAVAVELAKAGGVSWHSGQERGLLKLVMDRFRDRARLAITALERVQAAKQAHSPDPTAIEPGSGQLQATIDRASHEEVGIRRKLFVSEFRLLLLGFSDGGWRV
jgi:hypothetical protein